MDLAHRYEICSPGVIAENFDGDIVILNLEDGRYFSLRGAGPNIWNTLIAGATPQAILADAEQHRPALAEATKTFLCRMFDLQLIRPAGEAASSATVDWSTVKDADQPEIEVFDDLAELIMADPIHDVDAEVGWPLRKAA